MFSNMGADGYCVCHKCGYKTPHRRGIRCQEEVCPKCGIKMVREGGYHYNLIMEAKNKKKEG